MYCCSCKRAINVRCCCIPASICCRTMISDINCESLASSSLVQLARTMEYIWRFLLVQAVVIESIHSAQSPVCDGELVIIFVAYIDLYT